MTNVKIFTDNIEGEALNQIYTLAKLPAFDNAKIRIMPDVHAGAGCVIGFTADLGNKVIPNIVGVDIGCGMRVIKLGNIDIDFEKLDRIIREQVPAGHEVHNKISLEIDKKYIDKLICKKALRDKDRLMASLGTLGGGNHFIEIDKDDEGCKYLVIHTGSRNLGKQVAEIYQNQAIMNLSPKKDYSKLSQELISTYIQQGRQTEIQLALAKLRSDLDTLQPKIPKELSYLEGAARENYLFDMNICQEFAVANREKIANIICTEMNWNKIEEFESIHNYISFKDNIVRKGAISAYKGQKVIIPMNMRDGCIIGIGKGNSDWNQSAPHGAGRIMSRAAAKSSIKLQDYEKSMQGIWTSTVNESTIDESAFAYKPMLEIIDNIKDTVEIINIIKPIYNFKASE